MAIARFAVWAIWLDDRCPLQDGLEAIREKHEGLYYTAMGILDTHLPHKGPRFYRQDSARTKEIAYWGIGEIQLGGQSEPAIRILWFYDDEGEVQPRNIVCVDAYWKMEGQSSGELHSGDRIPAAAKLKDLYFDKKARGEVNFTDEEGGAS